MTEGALLWSSAIVHKPGAKGSTPEIGRRGSRCTDVEFTDVAQDIEVLRSRGDLGLCQGWVTAFSDGAFTDFRISDADELALFQWAATGTNDGPFGPFAPDAISFLRGLDVLRFDGDGRIARIEQYYDRLGVPEQLGHAPSP